MMVAVEPQPVRRRTTYSLRTLLLVTAIVALGIVVAKLYAELAPLRDEVRRLRDEVGALSVDDESKFYAIQARTREEFVWKWRIWIPEGREYQLFYSSLQIPAQGFLPSHGMITLSDPGEQWVEYSIVKDADSGRWEDWLTTRSGRVGRSIQEWVTWNRRSSTGTSVGHTTREFEPGEVIVLARERVSQKATSSSQIEDPAAGFMIWLAPTK